MWMVNGFLPGSYRESARTESGDGAPLNMQASAFPQRAAGSFNSMEQALARLWVLPVFWAATRESIRISGFGRSDRNRFQSGRQHLGKRMMVLRDDWSQINPGIIHIPGMVIMRAAKKSISILIGYRFLRRPGRFAMAD